MNLNIMHASLFFHSNTRKSGLLQQEFQENFHFICSLTPSAVQTLCHAWWFGSLTHRRQPAGMAFVLEQGTEFFFLVLYTTVPPKLLLTVLHTRVNKQMKTKNVTGCYCSSCSAYFILFYRRRRKGQRAAHGEPSLTTGQPCSRGMRFMLVDGHSTASKLCSRDDPTDWRWQSRQRRQAHTDERIALEESGSRDKAG